ncbi:TetR family transcriptional regulator [Microlunatus endophyticus]|uniref:TetR family transcriptional regulator n=1 Tax=Microlunatus endophyticus TaxID=1716077 RepID=A0A917S368_9ACTN|nr:TetR family transcriptional regulator [Microlunatus endophyticus]
MASVPSDPVRSERRPRSRRRLGEDERRAQIVRAALAVVARHGYAGASTTLIAAEAEVSKGLLWHYFADKNDLLKQAVVTTATRITDELIAELDVTAPPPELIRRSIHWIAAWSLGHRDELRAMDQISRSQRGADGLPDFTLADYEPTYASQEQLFRRGQQLGYFRPFDTRVMAVTYQGAIDMMLSYADSHPDIDIEQYADALTDIILAAVTA